MKAWHVTPRPYLESIRERGLMLDPPQRTFRCGRAVYLASSPADARRWAGEIARELGTVTAMVLLEVDLAGLVVVSAAGTEVGLAQLVVRSDVAADRVRVLEEFDAVPRVNHVRSPSGRRMSPEFVCPVAGCDHSYSSPEGVECHLGESHTEGELADLDARFGVPRA